MAWPPDVADGQIILASHINAIRDSVATWPGSVSAAGYELVNVSKVGIGTATPGAPLHVKAASGDGYMNLEGAAGSRVYAVLASATGSSWAAAGSYSVVDGSVGSVRLKINPAGYTMIGAPPGAPGLDTELWVGSYSVWFDEANNRLAVRCKTSTGVLKTGYITVT